tara:strand:- start:561 stop:1586 length:1026 start_codon:yes stop_codon:yes gene_type:complete
MKNFKKTKRVLVIAEAGVNHNGSEKMALKLITAAKKAGADIVKFQSFKAEELITKSAKKPKYINENKFLKKKSQYQILKDLELSDRVIKKLSNYCKVIGIEFLSSAFDVESIKSLSKNNIKRFKIPSGEITNFPYLVKIAEQKKPIILSTGMANMIEVKKAMHILTTNGAKKNSITVLHCTTDYPTSVKDVNLKAMLTLRDNLNVEIGYSDHTMGIEVSIAAVAMGAKVIEKHITLNKKLDGPDHKASLEPNEFKLMVAAIRNISLAIGDGIKKPTKREIKNLIPVRKSIKAKRSIKKGEILTEDNITTKRPLTGISAIKWSLVLGRKAKRSYKTDDNIVL